MAIHSTEEELELQGALERLFSLQTFGIKLGLEPIAALLDAFGKPHLAFPAIHVAGTNGKGSVCAMIASALQAAGLRVGLYTSPHLVHFDERIRVNSQPIRRDVLALYAREMLPEIERLGCTFFEGTTAIAFRYFAEERVDVAVVETGLGGRLDATNIITPLVSAITSIGFDHMKHLGDTLEEIAGEKAGIIKHGIPAIVGPIPGWLRDVFRRRAAEVGTELWFADDRSSSAFRSMSAEGTIASFMVDGREIADLHIDLIGRHQVSNARVALLALEPVRERFGLDDEIIRRGFGNVRANSGIRGRFEIVRRDPTIILDVAHNPDGARVLADTLIAVTPPADRKYRFVYGAVEDKDVAGVVRTLHPLATALYAVRAESHRSLLAEEIAHFASGAGITTITSGNVADGVETAIDDAARDETIVICGSFFVVAEAIAALEKMRSTSDDDIAGDRSPGDIDEASDESETHGLKYELSSKRPTVKDWSPNDQPRERLMRFGSAALSDAELLAILLRTGRQGEDAVQVSRNILLRFEGFPELAQRDYKELQEIPGVGPAKAVTLAAAFEIGRRSRPRPFDSRAVITGPEDVAKIFIPMLEHTYKEQFHVLILNSAGQLIRTVQVSEGNLNSSIVHPREVFRTAIIERAASIIGVHNHPSGNPTPSKEDLAITRQLVEAGDTLGIPLKDHIIIAGDQFVSLAERGQIE